MLPIIKTLDSNKDDGCDSASIKKIKIYSQSLILPFKTIFEQSLQNGIWPQISKKANVVPVY